MVIFKYINLNYNNFRSNKYSLGKHETSFKNIKILTNFKCLNSIVYFIQKLIILLLFVLLLLVCFIDVIL